MKEKISVVLEKMTIAFDKVIDFLMAKTAFWGKKLIFELNIFLPKIFKTLKRFSIKEINLLIKKISKTDNWKYFKENVKNFKKKYDKLISFIPKNVKIVIAYFWKLIVNFIKMVTIIIYNIIKNVAKETYKQINNLPHQHKRFLFILCLIFVVSWIAFSNNDHIKEQTHRKETYKEEVKKTDVKKNEPIVQKAKKKLKEPIKKVQIVIKKGDTLTDLLQEHITDYNEIEALVKSFGKCYDPRKLHPGKEMTLLFKKENFFGLELAISPEETCILEKKEDKTFEAKRVKKELFAKTIEQKVNIENSIFIDGGKMNIPDNILMDLIKIYSWDVDFVRDIRKNDTFTIIYESLNDKDGNFIKNGNILYANMNLSGSDIALHRYKEDYYKEDGSNIRKALLRTPINGARVSSSFGLRKHPVLGYSRKHTGVDFAAPRGTPIYAAGDGVITKRAWNGGYGNYVQIKHNGTMSTAYAHMSKFASGQGIGTRVKQGQVIGYVGTTGVSTGNHLHYEIIRNGVKVNPRTVTLPNKKSLASNELVEFKNKILKFKQARGTLNLPVKKPKSEKI